MKPFKLKKNVPASGYLQFWTEKPPTLIVTQFPKPILPSKLLTKVHPRCKPIEFIYRDKSN